MASIDVKTVSGGSAGTVELDDRIFGIQPNVPVMHQVVTAQLAGARAGTQSTKTRAEVRGGGAKPWKQKGTGRARAGSSRSPIWSGGGVALGPKPRSYQQRTPKKMIRLALLSALSDRANEGNVVVVDSWSFDTPSTRGAKAALAALGLADKNVLVVCGPDDLNVALSFRNLERCHPILATELNAYDVLVSDVVLFTKATLPNTLPAAPVEVATSPAAVAESVETTESEQS
jgi:large subunit ribosomal protein L4